MKIAEYSNLGCTLFCLLFLILDVCLAKRISILLKLISEKVEEYKHLRKSE